MQDFFVNFNESYTTKKSYTAPKSEGIFKLGCEWKNAGRHEKIRKYSYTAKRAPLLRVVVT